jgi:biopolymer transport protein ExbB
MISSFDLTHTLLLGWPILSVLLIFSILTVSIFFETRVFAPPNSGRLGLPRGRDGAKTLFNRAEQRLAVLGTLANAAPFVGLLGTVIGIIRAFHTISQASGSGGGMSLVAGGHLRSA